MSKLEQDSLIEERDMLYKRISKLADKEGEWSEDDRERWDAANARFDELNGQLRSVGVPTRQHGEEADGPHRRALSHGESHYKQIREECPDSPRIGFGQYLRALACGPRTDVESRALAEGADSTGGATVPILLWSQLIDVARATMAASQAGVRTVMVQTDKTVFPKQVSDPVAAWRNEAATIAESDPVFTKLTAEPKSLAVRFKASRELLMDGAGIHTLLQRSIARSLALELDRAILFGSGTSPEPKGIYNHAGIQELAVGGVSLEDFQPIVEAMGMVEASNEVPGDAMVMAPRTKAALANLQDTTNQPLNPPRSVANLRQLSTTAVPIDQGSGNDESCILLGDFSQVTLALREDVRVFVLNEVYSSTGEVGFIAHARADVLINREPAICKITGVAA